MKNLSVIQLVLTVFLFATLPISGLRAAERKDLGGATGGGNYGDRNATIILDRAQRSLLRLLQGSSDIVFKGLPSGTREKLIKAATNLRRTPRTQAFRKEDGSSELMFDYGKDENGEPYLVAAEWFYRAHAGHPLNHMDYKEINKIVLENQMLLLHEAAHTIGIGTSRATDHEARAYAGTLLLAMYQSTLRCMSDRNVVNSDVASKFSEQPFAFRLQLSQGFTDDYPYFNYPHDNKRNNESLLFMEIGDKKFEVKDAAGYEEYLRIQIKIRKDFVNEMSKKSGIDVLGASHGDHLDLTPYYSNGGYRGVGGVHEYDLTLESPSSGKSNIWSIDIDCKLNPGHVVCENDSRFIQYKERIHLTKPDRWGISYGSRYFKYQDNKNGKKEGTAKIVCFDESIPFSRGYFEKEKRRLLREGF